MSTTKRDMVMKIAEETGMIQQDVYKVIQKTLEMIMESLANGENVELRNFGVFELRERKQRIGRNPNKPEQVVTIPTRNVVKFKPGKIMKEKVSQGPKSVPYVAEDYEKPAPAGPPPAAPPPAPPPPSADLPPGP